MSLKVIRVIHQGQGRKIRIDTLSSWNELLQKISSKLNNRTIETIKDSDGDIVDDLEVLSHGDIITVTTVTPSTDKKETTTTTTDSLGTKIMRAMLPSDKNQTSCDPIQVQIPEVREQIMSILANVTQEKGTLLLRALRFLFVNIQTHPGDEKYKTISKSKLFEATEIDVPLNLMTCLGFDQKISTKKKKIKYVYKNIVHEPTSLAIISLLDNLFVELRQMSQKTVHKPLFTSSGLQPQVSGGETKSNGGTLWYQRHDAMAAASAAGLKVPILSSDRLKIYIDELRERRNKMFEDGKTQNRKVKLFNEGGAEINMFTEKVKNEEHEQQEEQQEEQQDEEKQGGGEQITLTLEEKEEIDTRNESLARQRLLRLRKASEDKKMQERGKFKSKATRELERMQTKEGKYNKSIVKIAERGGSGLSIMACFSLCENGQDVLDFVVDECLSKNAKELIELKKLQIHLECRDPTPRKTGVAEYISMASTSSTPSTMYKIKNSDEMSMLEWNCVPRGKIMLTMYLLNDDSEDNKSRTSLKLQLKESYQELLRLDSIENEL
jgi:hypothetical protein